MALVSQTFLDTIKETTPEINELHLDLNEHKMGYNWVKMFQISYGLFQYSIVVKLQWCCLDLDKNQSLL